MAYTPRLNDTGIANNPKWTALNPFYQSGYGMPNCTCYAWGRFWEISDPNNQNINRPNLSLGNAKEWWQYNITNNIYDYGQTPRLGATICFAPEAGSTRVGHVATVEEIYTDHIVTSNSDWNGRFFYTESLYLDANGKYHHDVYTSQGFIYNPWAEQPTPPPVEDTQKRHFPWAVAWTHWNSFKR